LIQARTREKERERAPTMSHNGFEFAAELDVVGLAVVGLAVVGLAVVGLAVVGLAVVHETPLRHEPVPHCAGRGHSTTPFKSQSEGR
jgi:hypothetical protein